MNPPRVGLKILNIIELLICIFDFKIILEFKKVSCVKVLLINFDNSLNLKRKLELLKQLFDINALSNTNSNNEFVIKLFSTMLSIFTSLFKKFESKKNEEF